MTCPLGEAPTTTFCWSQQVSSDHQKLVFFVTSLSEIACEDSGQPPKCVCKNTAHFVINGKNSQDLKGLMFFTQKNLFFCVRSCQDAYSVKSSTEFSCTFMIFRRFPNQIETGMSAVLILRCLARMSDSCTVQTYLTFLISASVITDRLRGLGALFLDSVDVSFPIRE